MKRWMIAMALASAALVGCATDAGKYGRPINPADGGDVSAVSVRVAAMEAKVAAWDAASTASIAATNRTRILESLTNTFVQGAIDATSWTNATAHGVSGSYTNGTLIFSGGIATNGTSSP